MNVKKKGETSYKKTAFGIIPRSKLIPLEIEGIKKAWDFVLEERKRSIITINSSFIKKLHLKGFKWIFPETGGCFRNIEVTVSNHTPPKFYLIPELMMNLCKDLDIRTKNLPSSSKSDFIEELIVLLSWAQHRFLWIHPFQDYNGRIARLLTNVILLNLNLPPIELKVETKIGRQRYIKALQKADKGNLKNMEELINEAIEESIKTILD